MTWEIKLSDLAVESFKKMDKQAGSRIKNKLYNRLAKQEDPRRHPHVKKIVGVQNLFRYRVGDYRVLFRVLDHQVVIIVVDAGHRSKIYDRATKIKQARKQYRYFEFGDD